MDAAVILAYAVWCAFCWVLRGGMYGRIHRALFKREPGTQVTRAVSALLMALPLAVGVDPALAVLWLSIWAAMTIGYFDDSMGLVENPRDYFWLAAWGACVSAVMMVPVAFLYSPTVLFWSPLGALAVVSYAVNKRFGGHWTQRAEAGTGFVLGVALGSAVLL